MLSSFVESQANTRSEKPHSKKWLQISNGRMNFCFVLSQDCPDSEKIIVIFNDLNISVYDVSKNL